MPQLLLFLLRAQYILTAATLIRAIMAVSASGVDMEDSGAFAIEDTAGSDAKVLSHLTVFSH